MRGVRRLGALFLCALSLVAALRGEALLKRELLLNRGYEVSVDRDGNPIYVKMVRKGELSAVQLDVSHGSLRPLSSTRRLHTPAATAASSGLTATTRQRTRRRDAPA